MATDRIEQAQRGFSLEETLAPGRRQGRPGAASVAQALGGGAATPRRRADRWRRDRRPRDPTAAPRLTRPFLSPGSLSSVERLRLINGIETVMAGAFAHLPLKRARYGVDPIAAPLDPPFTGR